MITVNKKPQVKWNGQIVYDDDYKGLSTDEKPTNVAVNSLFLELDTGKTFFFGGSCWAELGTGDTGFTDPVITFRNQSSENLPQGAFVYAPSIEAAAAGDAEMVQAISAGGDYSDEFTLGTGIFTATLDHSEIELSGAVVWDDIEFEGQNFHYIKVYGDGVISYGHTTTE